MHIASIHRLLQHPIPEPTVPLPYQKGTGYATAYLTPNQLLDFTAGEASLKFDVSTERLSTRDWIDFWVTPYYQHQQLPGDDIFPDLHGPPQNAVHIRMDNTTGGTMLRVFVVRNFVQQEVSGNSYRPYESVLTPSAVRRDTVELRLSRTHVHVGMPAYNLEPVMN